MATPKGGHYEGMPQLDPAFMPNLIFWLILTLIAVYFILTKIALPRIGGIIEDRRTAIASDLDAAADLKAKAEEAEASYQQALADARAEANRIAAEARASIQADLDVAIQKADAEIAAQATASQKRIEEIRASAAESVEAVAKDAVGDIVSAVSPVKGTAAAVTKAVTDALKGT